jgi:hypothetical protein
MKSTTTENAGEGGATAEDVRPLLARAERGDPGVLGELRAFLDARPEVWRQAGDLARHAEMAMLDLAAGTNLLVKESITRKLDELKRELAPSSALERLVADRVALCWLQAHHADLDAAAALAASGGVGPRSAHAQRRLGQANQRFLQAVKQLALVRKLLRPALSPVDLALRPVEETRVPRPGASRVGDALRDGVAVAN